MKTIINSKFACLDCRKVFNKHKYNQSRNGSWEPIEYDVVCPQCGKMAYPTGSAFKAPKQHDIKSWKKLRPLFESGYTFNPDFGNPFKFVPSETDRKRSLVPQSQFRKPARKRTEG